MDSDLVWREAAGPTMKRAVGHATGTAAGDGRLLRIRAGRGAGGNRKPPDMRIRARNQVTRLVGGGLGTKEERLFVSGCVGSRGYVCGGARLRGHGRTVIDHYRRFWQGRDVLDGWYAVAYFRSCKANSLETFPHAQITDA